MRGITHAVILAVGFAVASAGMAAAGQQRAYRVSDQQLKDLVNRIDATNRPSAAVSNGDGSQPIKNSQTADQAGSP